MKDNMLAIIGILTLLPFAVHTKPVPNSQIQTAMPMIPSTFQNKAFPMADNNSLWNNTFLSNDSIDAQSQLNASDSKAADQTRQTELPELVSLAAKEVEFGGDDMVTNDNLAESSGFIASGDLEDTTREVDEERYSGSLTLNIHTNSKATLIEETFEIVDEEEAVTDDFTISEEYTSGDVERASSLPEIITVTDITNKTDGQEFDFDEYTSMSVTPGESLILEHTIPASTDSNEDTVPLSKLMNTKFDSSSSVSQNQSKSDTFTFDNELQNKLAHDIANTSKALLQGAQSRDLRSLISHLRTKFMEKYERTDPDTHNAYVQCEIKKEDPMDLSILSYQTVMQGEVAYTHYCESTAVKDEMEAGSHVNCDSLTGEILDKAETNFLPTISQVDFTNLQADMQEVHRGLIGYIHVLGNISALQVDFLCILPRRAGIHCDQTVIEEAICSEPTPDPDVDDTCVLHDHINDLLALYRNLEYQHLLDMTQYGLTPEHSFDSVDVNPLECADANCGSPLTYYTLSGIYNSIQQALVAEETYGYLYASLVNHC